MNKKKEIFKYILSFLCISLLFHLPLIHAEEEMIETPVEEAFEVEEEAIEIEETPLPTETQEITVEPIEIQEETPIPTIEPTPVPTEEPVIEPTPEVIVEPTPTPEIEEMEEVVEEEAVEEVVEVEDPVLTNVNQKRVPDLVASYNSVKGIDFRFKPVEAATGYDIWRKNRGVWTKIATVKPSDLELENGIYKYFDTEPKDLYGKIYVYSVAARFGNEVSAYNEKGRGICRLAPPTLSTVLDQGNQEAYVEWTFGDKSTGYEVQVSKSLDFKDVTKIKVEGRNTLNKVIYGLSYNTKYYIRVRSYMTDSNNITYYSQYTSVRTVTPTVNGSMPVVKLNNVYNSVKGVDVRWQKVPGATGYIIWRKNRGVWTRVDTVQGGSTEQYFDTSVKDAYGKIYVYSVAAIRNNVEGAYNEKGRGICRLQPPILQSARYTNDYTVDMKWSFADKATGYEIQVSKVSDFNGKVTKVKIEGRNTLSELFDGFNKDNQYYIRIRSYMTDTNNITYYSQYSPVISPTYSKEINNNLFVYDGSNGRYSYPGAITGIDVSSHNGYMDWNAIKNDGISFAFIRVGYRGYTAGGVFPDNNFYLNIQQAKEAGLPVGVYFFSQATTDDEAREEAYFVLDQLNGMALDLPVVYDLETVTSSEGRANYLSGAQWTNNALIFADIIEQHGYQAMIYTNPYWANTYYDMSRFQEYPIWLAQYNHLPSLDCPFDFWQYSSEGRVNGVNGPVDMNLWFK